MRSIGFITVLIMTICGQFIFFLNSNEIKSTNSGVTLKNESNSEITLVGISEKIQEKYPENSLETAKMWYTGQDMALIQIQNNQ